jgi:hypothetical protein
MIIKKKIYLKSNFFFLIHSILNNTKFLSDNEKKAKLNIIIKTIKIKLIY